MLNRLYEDSDTELGIAKKHGVLLNSCPESPFRAGVWLLGSKPWELSRWSLLRFDPTTVATLEQLSAEPELH